MKLPSVEEYVAGIIMSKAWGRVLCDELTGYRNAWLEAAAEVAEQFVPTRLSTQTHGELIGERIRKLKEKP